MSWWISSKNKIIKKNPNLLVLAEQFMKEAFAHDELLHQQVLELQQQLDYKCTSRLKGRFTLIFIFSLFDDVRRRKGGQMSRPICHQIITYSESSKGTLRDVYADLSHGCVESNQIRKKGEKIFLLFTLSLEK
jgi:hypothetical protein